MHPIIIAEGLGKAYRSYHRQWARFVEWLSGDRIKRHHEHWVLRDVSFQVEAGESVAVIGQNGAGKSTLLKLLAGVIRPTTGSVQVEGRVAALLELGLGFHGDFTGRENLAIAGALLGLSPQEVAQYTDWILEFADIGEYIDEPVRTYSSGMQMRLAFALAVARRPDVLIVDEALSVGDIFFQQKCFDLIRAYNRQGTTLFFVTHGLGVVQSLCERALLLDHGRLIHDGSAKEAIDLYEGLQLKKRDANPEAIDILPAAGAMGVTKGSLIAPGAELLECGWYDEHGRPCSSYAYHEQARLRLVFLATRPFDDPHVGFKLRDKHGLVAYETNTYCQRRWIGPVRAGERFRVDFSFMMRLREGEYTVTVGMANGGYSLGSFREQICYAHGLAPLTIRRPADWPLWDGVADLEPSIDLAVESADQAGQASHSTTSWSVGVMGRVT
ncbi:MAG: ABC transporter ATP-binding protein [Burkholderiales bacterium]|nr:ABC transporter ATP-binding protein [Burkholderiales bacterium]